MQNLQFSQIYSLINHPRSRVLPTSNHLCTAMTAASTALNLYDIVYLILPYLCDDGFPKDLLFLQRMNSTWRAVIQNTSKLQKSLWLTKGPTKQHSQELYDTATKLPILPKRLLWVYSTELQEIVGLYSSLTSVQNLYCDGRASCLDMRLVESNLSVRLTYQAPQISGQVRYSLGICNTIRKAIQVVARSYRDWGYPEHFEREFFAFAFDWDYDGLLVTLVEVRFGDNWTGALKVL